MCTDYNFTVLVQENSYPFRRSNKIVLANVPYKTASEFLSVASGSRNIKVNAAGTSTTVINADLDFVLNSFTTIIAADF